MEEQIRLANEYISNHDNQRAFITFMNYLEFADKVDLPEGFDPQEFLGHVCDGLIAAGIGCEECKAE